MMAEATFQKLLAEKPFDPEVLLVYADWLEENDRPDDALAARLQRVVRDNAQTFTRPQAQSGQGYNARVARKWFAKWPGLRVVMVGYETITTLGLEYMPVGVRGRRRGTTPADDDPTSEVLYHRKGRGYQINMVAFLKPLDPAG